MRNRYKSNGDFSQHNIVDVSQDFGGYFGALGDFEEFMIADNKGKYDVANFQRGMRILKAYHDAASSSDNYNLSFDQFLDAVVRNSPAIGPRTKTYDILVASIGEAPALYGRSESWATDTVETLAYNGDGKIPKSYFTLLAALNEAHLNKPQWAQAVQYVAVNTVKDAASLATDVITATGDTLIGMAKLSKYLIPAAVIGAGVVGILVLKKKARSLI